MVFGPVGIRCPEHAGVRGPKRSATRGIRQTRAGARSLDTPATFGLIAINVAVYLVVITQAAEVSDPRLSPLFLDGALLGVFMRVDGEWYRLVTSMFLHVGLFHLVCNMAGLWWLGTIVERSLGTLRFVLLYFVSGLAGSAGALVFSHAYDITVGASGAVLGVMGALLVLEWLRTGSILWYAVGYIALLLAISFSGAGLSFGGHLGGVLGGVAATFVLAQTRYRYRRLGPAVVVLMAAASVVVAYVRVETYSLQPPQGIQPPIATAVTPDSASAAWAAARRASGTR
jgi:membrane associated rhomboid family serine protease